jgi:hypothetical protein
METQMSDDLFDIFKKNKHGWGKHGHHDDHHEHDHHDERHHSNDQRHYSAPHRGEDYSNDGWKTIEYGEPRHNSHAAHLDFQKQILGKILNNPKFLVLAVIAALLLLLLAVVILISILPFVTSVLQGLGKSGLKGIIDTIWQGTGK